MTIDIDKLRAAHAATTQGEWVPEPEPNGATFSLWVDTDSLVAEYNTETDADFIALAHNEFPAMLDEIERLRAAEKTEHDRRLAVETTLVNLLCVINDDKDDGFFICAEAKDRIKDAQDVMGVVK